MVKEKIKKQKRKEYKKKNKKKIAKYNKKWYNKNKKKIAKQKKEYRKKNKKKIAEYNKKWYDENKEEIAKQHKKWCDENREEINKKAKEYRQTLNGRASIKADRHNRRLWKKGLTLKIIQRVYKDNIKKYGMLTCELCGKIVKSGQDSIDHKIPLSRKGINLYKNLQIAHKTCNSKKGIKTMKEWLKG